MVTERRVRRMDVRVGMRDPERTKKLAHDLIEVLLAAACAVSSETEPAWKSMPSSLSDLTIGRR